MKFHKLFFVVLTALLLCAAAPTSAQERSNGAYIEVADSVHDFGVMERRGKNKSHTFHITNSGNEPLVLLSALTSCSCTKATFSKKPIPTGGKGTVKVVVEPSKVEKGVFNRIILLHSNASNSTVILTIKGLAK